MPVTGTAMHPGLREAIAAAMRSAELALAGNDLDGAFAQLERAHVLGQWHVGPHVRSHLGMLRIGWRRRDMREVIGQLLRIPGAILGSALGRVPRGNTGGAGISAFQELPIPVDLRKLLLLDARSSAHMTEDEG